MSFDQNVAITEFFYPSFSPLAFLTMTGGALGLWLGIGILQILNAGVSCLKITILRKGQAKQGFSQATSNSHYCWIIIFDNKWYQFFHDWCCTIILQATITTPPHITFLTWNVNPGMGKDHPWPLLTTNNFSHTKCQSIDEKRKSMTFLDLPWPFITF